MKFILVNRSILDYDKFREEFGVAAAALREDIREVADRHNLKLVRARNNFQFRKKAVFCNEKLDLELIVIVQKKSRSEFV